MPKRDADLLIEDMRVAMSRIERYTAGLNREAFLQDDKTIDAVVRNLEVLGEAARQMPSEYLSQHPEIPWLLINGSSQPDCAQLLRTGPRNYQGDCFPTISPHLRFNCRICNEFSFFSSNAV